ncbi:hypothetical protein ASPU41_21350 (plasmid) [Arthrobacter sp. U41]|nr:hypothetical protein ASPU41_21350 [Arthrobacter sp. U41]
MTGPAACDYLVHRELPLAVLDAPVGRPSLISHPVPERVAPLPGRPAGASAAPCRLPEVSAARSSTPYVRDWYPVDRPLAAAR